MTSDAEYNAYMNPPNNAPQGAPYQTSYIALNGANGYCSRKYSLKVLTLTRPIDLID